MSPDPQPPQSPQHAPSAPRAVAQAAAQDSAAGDDARGDAALADADGARTNGAPGVAEEPCVGVARATPVADASLPVPTGERCGNCGAPLFGPHCFRCGQPDHGLVRHFSSILGDLADSVLQIDSRLTRTLGPLLLRPGFLTMEYFAGRRVRYVSPVRLFFFLSVLAFFVAQWSFDANNSRAFQFEPDAIDAAMTVAAVEHARDAQLGKVRIARSRLGQHPEAAGDLAPDLALREQDIQRKANVRIAQLKVAAAQGKPPPEHIDRLTFGDDDRPWDPVTHPLRIAALPAFANGWINLGIGRAQGNVARIKQDPRLLFDAWMSALPTALIVLLPLLALLLKLAYPLKRRLYMEHFIVALHSHAFLCLALLLAVVLDGMRGLAAPGAMRTVLGWAQGGMIAWMPVYLWLMQRRVYAQGVAMTTFKYATIGSLYLILLSLAAVATFLVKLIWL